MEKMKTALSHCEICPRGCGINRTAGKAGWCHAPLLPKVALVSGHLWEEPPISGTKGSGTIFFQPLQSRLCLLPESYHQSGGLRARSQHPPSGGDFLEQQERGFHNINLVSAVQFIPQVAKALESARAQGLRIPVVYNSNGYESLTGLRMLDGLVDIYLPDFKYWNNDLGVSYSHAPHYRETAAAAILEMRRQVPQDVFDAEGLLQKGLLLRHLILPGQYRDSMRILDWVRASLGEETLVSLMSQYTPLYRAKEIKALSRKLTTFEYEKVIDYFFEIGLKNGFMQKRSSATGEYTPTFDLSGVVAAESFMKREENHHD